MRNLVVALTAVACCFGAASAGAQQYVQLPDFTWVNDVTPDGSVVVGSGNGGGFYWNWRTDPAPIDIGGHSAVAVSDDGTWIVGNITDPGTGADVAGRWSLATGWQNLGYLPNALSCPSRSDAYDISGDGSTVVGLSWDGCSARGFVWTEATGMLELQNLANGHNRASAISGNGLQIAGFAQGNFDRTPAVWEAANQNGLAFDANDVGEIYGFTEDGSTFVGTYWFGVGAYYRAALGDPQNGFTLDLGSLDPNWSGNASDLSEDGSVVVGYDVLGLARKAWVWTPGGIVGLESLLTNLGIPSGTPLAVCRAVSDDGKVVVGGTDGFPFAGFIAELAPQDSPWEDLGGGTNGINGHPTLSGTGTLVSGDPTSIDLVQGPSGAISVVWTSVLSVPLPVAGGTIYANPYASEILIPLNGSGEFHAAFPWFAGVPSGLSLHFQFIIQDLSRIYGFSLSNGLKATAP